MSRALVRGARCNVVDSLLVFGFSRRRLLLSYRRAVRRLPIIVNKIDPRRTSQLHVTPPPCLHPRILIITRLPSGTEIRFCNMVIGFIIDSAPLPFSHHHAICPAVSHQRLRLRIFRGTPDHRMHVFPNRSGVQSPGSLQQADARQPALSISTTCSASDHSCE